MSVGGSSLCCRIVCSLYKLVSVVLSSCMCCSMLCLIMI